MNNNPEPSGLRDSELREDRKTFSLIGLACLAAFGPDRFLIPAMLLILAAIYGIRGREMA